MTPAVIGRLMMMAMRADARMSEANLARRIAAAGAAGIGEMNPRRRQGRDGQGQREDQNAQPMTAHRA